MTPEELLTNYYTLRQELETEWRAMARSLLLWTETIQDHVARSDHHLAFTDFKDMRSPILKRFIRITVIRSLIGDMEDEVKKLKGSQ